MKNPVTLLTQFLHRFAPKTLFARAFLILVLPVVLIQLITVTVFYERHWASVTRQLSSSLAGEIVWFIGQWESHPDERYHRGLILRAQQHFGMGITFGPPMRLPSVEGSQPITFPQFESRLHEKLPRPFTLRYVPRTEKLLLYTPTNRGMLTFLIPQKRLASSTTIIFIGWIFASGLLLSLIALLFLRNQVKPIIKLAEAAEQFGRGQALESFRPSGAREVRRAGTAFAQMQARIRRQVESRTTMLSGISHDLRTPLTRMKLALEMQKDSSPMMQNLRADLQEMQEMIESYLSFASGTEGEEVQTLSLQAWLEDALRPYQENSHVHVTLPPKLVEITLRPMAMRRALHNLIENALRYGDECWISIILQRKQWQLRVEDNGPGIPPEQRDEVFRAFKRLEQSRNRNTGGIGLGLTIVRDIVHAHGGDVLLGESKQSSGLNVSLILPL